MANVGMRKGDACKMITTLLQGMFPTVQKVTVDRNGYIGRDGYNIKIKRPTGFLTITGNADTIMKVVMKELNNGKVQEE